VLSPFGELPPVASPAHVTVVVVGGAVEIVPDGGLAALTFLIDEFDQTPTQTNAPVTILKTIHDVVE
jgi:hypothetical protein